MHAVTCLPHVDMITGLIADARTAVTSWPAGLAACFPAASSAVADRLSVQVLMLWLVQLLFAFACNPSRLLYPSSPVHG
jgi:hypothetical protein